MFRIFASCLLETKPLQMVLFGVFSAVTMAWMMFFPSSFEAFGWFVLCFSAFAITGWHCIFGDWLDRS